MECDLFRDDDEVMMMMMMMCRAHCHSVRGMAAQCPYMYGGYGEWAAAV